MFQFNHVNSYSRELSKKAKHSKWTARDVIAEATRDPSAIPHVKNPLPPVHVFGKPIDDLLGTLDHWAANTKDAGGKRAARKDAVCLLAGVFSVPDGTSQEQWSKIKNDAIKHLQNKYGDRLQTVLEHVDEEHPHCHYYVVPRPGEAFEVIHEGRAAVKEFVKNGGSKLKSNAVYREAMRGFQDEYFDAVGAPNGMTRIGPGRRRLSNEAWRAEEQQAEAIARKMKEADALKAEAESIVLDAEKIREVIIQTGTEEAILKSEQIIEISESLKQKALEEAAEIAKKALEKADEIEQNAEIKGFEEGIKRIAEEPFFKKTKLFFKSIFQERDELKAQAKTLNEEKESWKKKATKLLEQGNYLKNKLATLVPKLKAVEKELKITKEQLKQASGYREKAEILSGELSAVRSRNVHLEAVVEALNTKVEPLKQKPVVKNTVYEKEDDVTLG